MTGYKTDAENLTLTSDTATDRLIHSQMTEARPSKETCNGEAG